MKNLIIITTFTLLSTLSSFAAVDCRVLEKNWLDRYHDEFKIAWTKKGFTCPSSVSRVAETFHLLETIKFSGKYKPNFYNYIKDGLKSIRYVKTNSKIEWAYASEKGRVITLHEEFVKDDDQIQRVQKLIHEARHVRKKDPGHKKCKRGASKGKSACDAKFEAVKWKGSGYNFGFNFLYMIKNNSYNHTLSKRKAKWKMKWMLANRFNSITNAQIRQYSK